MTESPKEPLAWLNGEYIPYSQCRLPVHDLGVVAGAALTEMVRTFHRVPFRLDAHLDRLEWGLQHLGISPPVSRAELIAIVEHLIAENRRLLADGDELGIILFVTAGNNLTYLGLDAIDLVKHPTVCVHTFRLPFELWKAKYTAGQHLVSHGRAASPEYLDPRLKSRSRMAWWLADAEARQRDPAALALVSNERGFVTETSTGNVCIVRGGRVFTPKSRDVLGGISLQVVREIVHTLGLSLEEAELTANDVARAEEAWLTSTTLCIVPVTRMNGQPIANGLPGPLYQRVLARWNELVGLDIAQQMQDPAGCGTRNRNHNR